jgi:CheY-like chemotaxis protein
MKKLSDCRVSLVDDVKGNLDILVEGLKPDHKLSLALNGEMALQIAARTPPDPVMLEVPELKGRYCTDGSLRILLATKPYHKSARLMLIFTTGFGLAVTVRICESSIF